MFRDLRARLKTIAGRGTTLLEKFNESLAEIAAFMKQVREHVNLIPFKDTLEEVYFFKFEKPEYFALQIYHVALFGLLNGRPAGVPELLRVYYLEELGFIARFFKQYAFLYEYYRSGYTELDEMLFVRGAEVKFPLLQELPVLDAEFSTAGDYLFAKFMAYEDLQEYILGELKKLDQLTPVVSSLGGGGRKCFDWSGEIINLVELGYGIWLSGQIGEGKAGLQEIFNWLEQSFGVEIGIPANRFREIKRRKRLSRTRFMDFCKDKLLVYMDEDDAYRPEGSSGKNVLN